MTRSPTHLAKGFGRAEAYLDVAPAGRGRASPPSVVETLMSSTLDAVMTRDNRAMTMCETRSTIRSRPLDQRPMRVTHNRADRSPGRDPGIARDDPRIFRGDVKPPGRWEGQLSCQPPFGSLARRMRSQPALICSNGRTW